MAIDLTTAWCSAWPIERSTFHERSFSDQDRKLWRGESAENHEHDHRKRSSSASVPQSVSIFSSRLRDYCFERRFEAARR